MSGFHRSRPLPVENQGGEELLQQEARRLLRPFNLTNAQNREAWEAFKANPDGVERCALRAKAVGQREGRTAAGLFLTMLRGQEHLLEAKPDTPMPTGWRWVRANHGSSGRYVEDPEGIDKLPQGYDFTSSPRHDSPRETSDEMPDLSSEMKAQFKRLAGRSR